MTDDVSRETVTPPVPASARGVFADRVDLAERYVAWLASEGVVRGLIGPREVPRLWDRHVLNSAVLSEVVPDGATVCDVGSGAGLPGLVLAIRRPDLVVVLLEPLLRRVTFLHEVVDDLGLADQVEVLRGRAEEVHGRRVFDVVTSRAVAPLDRLLRWSMPLVAPEGAMIALKGTRAAEEIAEHRAVWSGDLGCSEPEIVPLGVDLGEQATQAVRVAWADPSRVSWPFAPASARSGRSRTSARKRRRPQ